MDEKYRQLAAHLTDVHNLTIIYRILSWDQQVNMPPGGDAARAAQMVTVWRLRHELFASDTTARLLEEAAREVAGAPFDSDEASLIRVARREYDAAAKQLPDFVGRHIAHCEEEMKFFGDRLDAIVAPTYSFASSLPAVAGYPNLSIPVGLTPEGKPAGLWMCSGFLKEPTLPALAYDLE